MRTKLIIVTAVLLFLTFLNSAKASYIETMPFNKMSFDQKHSFKNYLTIKETKKKLNLKGLPPKDNYTVSLNLNLKTKGEYYFWNQQLKTGLITPFQKNTNYTLESFLPAPIKNDLYKIKTSSSHKNLSLIWLEWQNNQNLNKKVLKQETPVSNSDFHAILTEYTQQLTTEKIKFGDLILFVGTEDIDNNTNIVSSVIYFGNGVVLEKMNLPGNKTVAKFSYLKDVQDRYNKKVLDLKTEVRRIKTSKQFNLANKIEEIKKQDFDLEASASDDLQEAM